MSSSTQFLNPSKAAKLLGVSAKALRIYEQRGLLEPLRNDAGWRTYGPNEMARAAEIVALRELGLSLGQVARVRRGNAKGLESVLVAHQAMLEGRLRSITTTVQKVRHLRDDLASGQTQGPGELAQLLKPAGKLRIAFDLPWPWGGEQFELSDIRALNYIIGPLGSGKTRLAKRIAEALPDTAFLGMERFAASGTATLEQLVADPAVKSRVDQALDWLVEEGATVSDALVTLLARLESDRPATLVIDMLEQGLDKATQEALIAHLRRRVQSGQTLFFLTRSNAILDLNAVSADETIILCPANHSPPTLVEPYHGAPGYEAVATCLASPEVRARTEGVIAWRPKVA